MKRAEHRSESGAALLITLVLLSLIAIVSISYLSITRQHAQVSGTLVSSSRASLGEKAALSDSVSLLESLTRTDDYLVTLATIRDPSDDNQISRYSFITVIDDSELTHYPLFAGGEAESESLPTFNQISTVAMTNQSVAPPPVSFEEADPARVIQIPSITHLNEGGELERESRRPRTNFIELPQEDDLYQTRYTFWVEDLESFPNLDTSSSWTDQHGSPLTTSQLDYTRFGYSSLDPRAGSNPDEPGLRLNLASNPNIHFQFPSSFRGQRLTGQVAPGLSSRELNFLPWKTDEFTLEQHPFFQFNSLASLRSSHFSNPSTRVEPRFTTGLYSYRYRPTIPYGHDYADEGKGRFPLNHLIAEKDLEIANIIERNLPEFEQRKGGFPAGESYLHTLAASAIDYADDDSLPSLPGNTINGNSEVFRGVDSYCPVNEFFVKFEYVGYHDRGDHYEIIFEATPYAEFWNPFNKTASFSNVTLKYRFLEDIRFRANSEWHRIEDDDLEKDDASSNPVTISVSPNDYVVHQFGVLRWRVEVKNDPDSPIAFPVVQDIRGVKRSSTRANYELLIDGVVVDSCGRKGTASDPDFGFFFSRYSSVINPEEHFMRMTTPALSGRAYGFNPGFGSHLGDPWMPYYSLSTADGTTPPTYRTKATPGSRNFDHDKVKSGREDLYKDQARVRDWPDRGYDPDVGPSPANDTELPTAFSTPAEPGKAPWRISNEGRYFSVTELGNIHDPVMWIYGPKQDEGSDESVVKKQSVQHFDKYRERWLKSLPSDAEPGAMWGGGNTLRIGRPEHERFDQPGMRASQLLDLFHTGVNGTNLLTAVSGTDFNDLYHFYDPRDHQPLTSGLDETEAAEHPYNHLYGPDLHAQSPYRWINGHLNLNSAPTLFEIESLLRGPFVSSWFRLDQDHYITPTYTSADIEGQLQSGLQSTAIPAIARGLYEARPFYSPSHFARVLSQLIKQHDALPSHHNDAEAEETFARIFNTTTLRSRHFRIYTYAETYHSQTDDIVARERRVYHVFLRPQYDEDGNLISSQVEFLSSAEL